MLLPIEEVNRRRRLVRLLTDELRARGRHVSDRGTAIWAAKQFLGPGREITVIGGDFVWQQGSYIGAPIAPVKDVPHAADLIDKELSAM
ncbi:hypothetical protein ACGFNU_24335 [Spirillospora sp. NPDC048911]|uniref:hypothetical protein n=1 Tax=Spirillospora sp. NPDC048911 TaxID=3364527 RepID=UPI0037169574